MTSQLPPEIFAIIAEQCDRSALATFALVSTVAKAIALPRLYRHLYLMHEKKSLVDSLLRTLATNSHIGSMVHLFAIDITPLIPRMLFPVIVHYPPKSLLQALCSAFSGMSNLRDLEFGAPLVYDGAVLQRCSSTSIRRFVTDINVGMDTLEWFMRQPNMVHLSIPNTETGTDMWENELDQMFEIKSFPNIARIRGMIWTIGSIVLGSRPPLTSITLCSHGQEDRDVAWMCSILSLLTTPLQELNVEFPLEERDLQKILRTLSQTHATSIIALDLTLASVPTRDKYGKWNILQQYLSKLTSLAELSLPVHRYDSEEEDSQELSDAESFTDMCFDACPVLSGLGTLDQKYRVRLV